MRLHKKADLLTKTQVDGMKDRKICVNQNSFDLGKNGCHRPSGLDGRLICCGQAVNEVKLSKLMFFLKKIDNFSSGACIRLGCLNKFIVLISLY